MAASKAAAMKTQRMVASTVLAGLGAALFAMCDHYASMLASRPMCKGRAASTKGDEPV